jgi:Domain of unknown function (DUF4333)
MGKVLLAPLVLVLVASAACGGSGGSSKGGKPNQLDKSTTKSLDKAGVEQAVGAKLTALQGQASKSVTCPQSLRLAVNASIQCTLTTEEDVKLPVTATVSAIRGETVDLDVASPWVSKALLSRLLVEELTQRVTPPPKTVTCPKDLKSEVKATMNCMMATKAGSKHEVTVTVTAVDNSRTEFDWSVKPVT